MKQLWTDVIIPVIVVPLLIVYMFAMLKLVVWLVNNL